MRGRNPTCRIPILSLLESWPAARPPRPARSRSVRLAYEGDPFDRAPAAATAPDGEDALGQTFDRLIAAMDSPSWKIRREATEEAANLVRREP